MNTTRPLLRWLTANPLAPARHLVAALVLTLAALSACGEPAVDDDSPNVTGESHWMESCEESAQCGDGESCLCGVCTVSCQVNDACPAEAICASATQACTIAYCTEACAEDADCPNDLVCNDGFCAGPGASGGAVIDASDATPPDRAPCAEDADCSSGLACDGGLCVEETTAANADTALPSCTDWSAGFDGGVELRSTHIDLSDTPERGCITESLQQLTHDPSCGLNRAHADLVFVDGALVAGLCTPCGAGASALQTLPGYGEAATFTLGQRGVNVKLTQPRYETTLVVAAADITVHSDADTPQIHGDIRVEATSARVRNLDVYGDVHIGAKDASLAHMRVRGDLNGEGKNLRLFNVRIDGDVDYSGKDPVWAGVEVAGEWDVSDDITCFGCASVEPDSGD